MSAWGEPAVGEYRGSVDYPGESSLVGLLGAALGLRREDEEAHAALARGYGFAVGVQAKSRRDRPRLLRDYQTAQVPGRASLKGRPHATRRDELSIPKNELNTILSTRDYWQDCSTLVALQPRAEPRYSLEQLVEALSRPRFVLYLGRKSCPPSAPLFPQIIDAPGAHAAFEAYRAKLASSGAGVIGELARMHWGDGVDAGVEESMQVLRNDRLIRRRGWQFGERVEHIKLMYPED